MAFEQFPYTNFHELNLDWIVSEIKRLTIEFAKLDGDFKDLKEYVEDYFASTDFAQLVNDKLDEMLADGSLASLFASYTFRTYNTMTDAIADTLLIDGSTIETLGYYALNDDGGAIYKISSTADNELSVLLANGLYANFVGEKASPLYFGAKADGTTDDSYVINRTLQNYDYVIMADKDFKINSTIIVPYGKQLDGQNARLLVDNSLDPTYRTNLPTYIALFLEGREPVNGTHKKGFTREIKNIRLEFTGTSATNIVGIYMGYRLALDNSLVSVVNNAFTEYSVSNIHVTGFETNIQMAEVWNVSFSDIHSLNAIENCLLIAGQCVNNRFVNCEFSGFGNSNYAIVFDLSSNYSKRSEGNAFSNCFIGYAKTGLYIVSTLQATFNNCIIDLNTVYAIRYITAVDCSLSNCWISNTNDSNTTIYGDALSTFSNDVVITFNSCSIYNNGNALCYSVGVRQMANIFNSCYFNKNISTQANTFTAVIGCAFNIASGDTVTVYGLLRGCFRTQGRGTIADA